MVAGTAGEVGAIEIGGLGLDSAELVPWDFYFIRREIRHTSAAAEPTLLLPPTKPKIS